MPTVSGSAMEETLATINYEVEIIADPGTQLESIIIRDRVGGRLEFEPSLEPCTTDYYVGRANSIARRRFPLNVEIIQCDDSRTGPDENPRLEIWPRIDDPPPDCSPVIRLPNPACDEADASAGMARVELERLCREVESCRREYREYLAVAALAAAMFILSLTLATAAAAGGGWIGAIIAIVMFAAAGFFLLMEAWATLRAGEKRRELTTLEDRLRGARNLFEESLRIVYHHCCPGSFDVNTEMPC